MTEAEFTSTPTRQGTPFEFVRVRSRAELSFLPGDGAKLRFVSKDVDSLTIPGLPVGFLAAGDAVRVKYRNATVFVGDVDRVTRLLGGGTDATEEVVCCGPWSKMARLVYRQYWKTASGYQLSSRLILNQHQSNSANDADNGRPQNLNSELYEIASHGATPCGYTVARADVSVSTKILPFDECRDITVADAIRRELRFFPKTVCRFDYSGSAPALSILRVAPGGDAAYVAGIPKSERQYEYNAHPINGVDLEIETTGDVDGVPFRELSHQRTENASGANPDCLYATLRVSGGSSSTVRQSFKSVTENLPTSLNDVDWWKSKHPRLANVAASAITISDGARSGTDDAEDYPRISAASVGEISEAGLLCRVESFTCKATIDKGTDREEDIYLTMNFLTTNAEGTAQNPHTYTWNAESSATSGETVPSGLAAAILADRSGALRAERMTIRLGDTLPTLGDSCDGLILQWFEVDCSRLAATLDFGAPEYLSPEDMASLLSGFRNKQSATCAASRVSGKKADDGREEVGTGGIPPLSSTEFAPGRMVKMTLGSEGGSDSSGGGSRSRSGTVGAGKIVLDTTGSTGGSIELATADVPSGKTIGVHTLTIVGAGTGGTNLTFKILSDADISISPGSGGSSLSGTVEFVGGIRFKNESNFHQLEDRIDSLNLATGDVTVGENWTLICDAVPVSGLACSQA